MVSVAADRLTIYGVYHSKKVSRKKWIRENGNKLMKFRWLVALFTSGILFSTQLLAGDFVFEKNIKLLGVKGGSLTATVKETNGNASLSFFGCDERCIHRVYVDGINHYKVRDLVKAGDKATELYGKLKSMGRCPDRRIESHTIGGVGEGFGKTKGGSFELMVECENNNITVLIIGVGEHAINVFRLNVEDYNYKKFINQVSVALAEVNKS